MKSARRSKPRLFALVFCLTFLQQQTALAALSQSPPQSEQGRSEASPPPLPAQLRAAHRVFVSNLGADFAVPGDPDAAYNQFYADLQSWGRYQLVTSPAEADLIFQLHAVAPIADINVTNGGGSALRRLELQLAVLDPATHTILWSVQVPVRPAIRKEKMKASLQRAVENVTSKLKLLSGEALNPQESAALTQSSVDHSTRNALLWFGGSAGLALAGSLILYHEYNVDKPAVPPALTCSGNTFFCGH